MGKRFTTEEIEELSKSEYVKIIRENRLSFTFEFRMILWESWEKHPVVSTIRESLAQYGFDPLMIGSKVTHHLHSIFKQFGRPSNGKYKGRATYYRGDPSYLLSTGLFVRSGRGLSFHPDLFQEILQEYPQHKVEDILIRHGLDLDRLGYHRIYRLKRKLKNPGEETSFGGYPEEAVHNLKTHPYVKKITCHRLSFRNEFYREAYRFIDLTVDEILAIFEMNPQWFTDAKKARIKYEIRHFHDDSTGMSLPVSPLFLKIQGNIVQALLHQIDLNFAAIGQTIQGKDPFLKKALCQRISTFPHDGYDFTLRKILKKIGISKSCYYAILKNPQYGKKQRQDEEDIKIIREILDSEPDYPMGSRMVYMRMKRITDHPFSRKKIMRLMRKFDLLCPVRKASISRQSRQKLLKENMKPNLLKRQFRFYRPLRAVLTDVSYLKYGNHKTAYLSVIKDAASGKILACEVSDTNDVPLILETLDQLQGDFGPGLILFHSDQGSLYLSPVVQSVLKKRGWTQSMSRRGNCWDNASQESYFGHFKDECDYLHDRTLEDVRTRVKKYVDYYNDRRPQWTRGQMTPTEFETYLLTMNEADFQEYVAKERVRYDKMMEKAKEKAKQRAHDLGAG